MIARASAAALAVFLLSALPTPTLAQIRPTSIAAALVKSPVLITFESSESQLSPGARCRIDALLAKFRTALKTAGPNTTAASVMTGAMPPGGDVAEMVYIVVMMEAANDEDADLAVSLAETEEQIAAKQALRAIMANINAEAAAKASMAAAGVAALEKASVNLPPGPCAAAAPSDSEIVAQNAIFRAKRVSILSKVAPRITAIVAQLAAGMGGSLPLPSSSSDLETATIAKLQLQIPGITPSQAELLGLAAIQEALQSQLDGMNETSEMTSMNLQMAMDRRSLFVEALSNLMKKVDSTQETIVQNLK
jgi:hypothetical protein